MSPKTIKVTYWVLNIIFCLFHVGDAYGGLSKAQAGVDAMNAMGYPIYLMGFLAVLKLLGVIALLQNKFKTIKEWAFAGFSFTLIGATVSHICVNDPVMFIVMPIVLLVLLFALYYFWRRMEQAQPQLA
ncbi:DoxX family protein [Mucilaginibacter sp. BT774]|uniref:DoxX family protein n=1 Tax=Mucilaginibacter sp. BT774 TaxID=3062276 RepID=UPI002674B963|nr:DoxX family protein [Mucilaginibacter sp. BT774]MDO3626094.1 DoxX family protein [Mucilaginibacter sp. BT774]